MDLKRYEEIDGLKALEIFSKKQGVYDKEGAHYCADDSYLWMTINGKSGVFNLGIEDILKRKWYVKKPFDVRAEMIARPDEWVGAFKRDDGKWMAIGFDLDEFEVSTIAVVGTSIATPKESALCQMLESSRYLDHCIPIEDVPKEELA